MSPTSFSRRLPFVAWLIGNAACAQQVQSSAGDQRLLILSKNEQQLSIVDPATLKIVGKVPTGPDPHEVVASTDGTRAYVSNYGGGAYNTLTVIDLVNQKKEGAAKVCVRFAKYHWDLTLARPGTRVALEIYGRWPAGTLGIVNVPGAPLPE